MDFVDDDLHDSLRSGFLSHAALCPSCRIELQDFMSIRNALANLPRNEISSEFNFRLKSSIRLENTRLGSPLYRFRLFIGENMVSVLGVPVAAALCLTTAVLFFHGPGNTVKPLQTASQSGYEMRANPFSAPAETLNADENYVLESLDLSEAGLNSLDGAIPGEAPQNTHTISELNF
jgi:hypothetical protein